VLWRRICAKLGRPLFRSRGLKVSYKSDGKAVFLIADSGGGLLG